MSERDLARRLAELPIEKRALLFKQLKKQKEQTDVSQAPIPRQPRRSDHNAAETDVFPMSFAQQRLWILDRFEPGSAEYNIPEAYHIRGDLQAEILQRTLEAIVARHESLRTTFSHLNGGDPVQTIARHARFDLPVIDLRHRPSAEREAEALGMATADARRPFDLATGPLVRAILFQLDDDFYLLHLNMHHIVSDNWSHGVFIRELGVLYEALAAGQPSPLPELPIQYADFAVWQREWLQGQALQAQVAYWKQQLAGVPALELPTDHPRPAIRTHQGRMQTLTISLSLTESLRAIGRQSGGSLFMTLLAAYNALLYHYTGQQDIAVGTLIANRKRIELEGLIGFFANTLALRTDLAGDPTFRQLLHRMQDVAFQAYEHQDLPFEKLVEELQPKRDLSRTPLFQVMLILQNAPTAERLTLTGLTLSPVQVDSETAKFDLTLYLTDTPQGLVGGIEYNTDLFDATTIKRTIGHLQTLLTGIVADPDQRLPDLPLLAAAERQQILVTWNATPTDSTQTTCIHHLFETQAARTPDAVAVVFEAQQLTYGELDRRTNQLANLLGKLGIAPEALVGLCMERSVEMVIALLGILKAGGAYVPLDPTFPQERLSFTLQDSRVAVLLAQQALLEKLSALGADSSRQVLCLDADWTKIAQESQSNPHCPLSAANLAYLSYTSGSTGQPKGVPIPHAAMVNFIHSMRQQLQMTTQDTLLAITTLSFDIAGLELYLPLIVGARVVVISRQVASAGEQLHDRLKRLGITAMQATPATWRLLLVAGWQGGRQLKILCGGEALPHDLANQLLNRGDDLWNLYGPTETTIWSAACRVASKTDPITIGRPIAHTEIYLLNSSQQPVPIGVPGELYIGGAGLSRGYHNRPALAAEKFVPHPFSDQPDARLYRTGDLARYLPDSTIEFLGRLDQQVKVRGFRIELGEIEAALRQHPAIRQAVAMARQDTLSDKRLVAYLVADPAQTLSIGDLRSFLKQKLPEYMLPAAFVTLDALPLTPNGKVDRRALPAPDAGRSGLMGEFVAPRTPAEESLAEIWAQILGIERVGVHDNFFELGGDSLLVIRVVTRASQMGLDITTRQVFQHQTVAELAAVVGAVQIQAEQGLVVGPVPLTPTQYQFLEADPQNPNYHSLGYLLEIQSSFDPATLEQAAQHLYHYHDALRLRLVREGAEWRMSNAGPEQPVPFWHVELSALSEQDLEDAIESVFDAMQKTFDMARGPLLQIALLDLGPHRPSRLLLGGHYLALDILSWQVFLADLDTVYQQLAQGQAVKLPPKPTSYQQWANRLAEYTRSAEIKQELAYWLAESRTRPSYLLADDPDGVNTLGSADTISVFLTPEESQALLKVPDAYDVQVDDVLLTALAQTFARWSESRSLLLQLIGHGREAIFEDLDPSRTVGWFTTFYPVLLNLDDTQEPTGALESIKAQLRRIPSHGLGYGLLRYAYEDQEIAKRLKALPRPKVTFNYIGPRMPQMGLFRPLRIFGGYYHDQASIRPTWFQVMAGFVSSGQLQINWEHSQNVHHRETVEKLANDFLQMLRLLIAPCQAA